MFVRCFVDVDVSIVNVDVILAYDIGHHVTLIHHAAYADFNQISSIPSEITRFTQLTGMNIMITLDHMFWDGYTSYVDVNVLISLLDS